MIECTIIASVMLLLLLGYVKQMNKDGSLFCESVRVKSRCCTNANK